MAHKFFRDRQIFINVNVSFESSQTFAVGTDKGFEFWRENL